MELPNELENSKSSLTNILHKIKNKLNKFRHIKLKKFNLRTSLIALAVIVSIGTIYKVNEIKTRAFSVGHSCFPQRTIPPKHTFKIFKSYTFLTCKSCVNIQTVLFIDIIMAKF